MTFIMKATILAFAIATTLPGVVTGDFVEHATPPDDLPDGWNTIQNNDKCANSNCCEQCQGHCTNDDDCRGAGSPLVCYMREWEGPIDGCVGASDNGKGYCIHPTGGYLEPDPSVDPRFLNIPEDKNCTEATPCENKCEGGCETDEQCAGTNACWPLSDTEAVKDCNSYTGSPGTSYCGGSRPPAPTTRAPSLSPAPTITDRPTWHSREDYGRLILTDECPLEGCPVCGGKMPGGCSADSDCAEGLVCAERTGREKVSGCVGAGIDKANYCYAENYDYLPPRLAQPPEVPEKNTYFFHDVELPEKCELYAADKDQEVKIPVSGNSGVGEAKKAYGEITYIFVMDYSRSTLLTDVGSCGDTHKHWDDNLIIDCEIMALDAINNATLHSGNVDLVGLVQFGSEATYVQDLVTPWAQGAEYSRDALIVEKAREHWPEGNTNFQAGIDQACQMARSDKNTNDRTVIIMISDGLPNRGTSTEEVITTNCNDAIVMTYAATAAASCSEIDVAKNIAAGADPDTLNAIAEYGGGTCTEVPDVTDLPALLIALDETTWDGVRITVNDTLVIDPNITYEVEPSFTGPKDSTYDAVVTLPGPGEYDLCLEATSSTSGEPEFDKKCTNLVVVNTAIEPENEIKSAEFDFVANFTASVTALGKKPGCDNLSGLDVEIRDCEGNVLETKKTDSEGEVTYNFGKDNQDPRVDCFEACFKDARGEESCTKTVVEWWDTPSLSPSSAPSLSPSGKPSGAPSVEPSLNPSNSVAPSGAPSPSPSMNPSNSVAPSGAPSSSPSGEPTVTASSSPSASPSESPSGMPSGGPSVEPSGSPSVVPTPVPSANPSGSPSNAPSSERSGAPSPNPSDRPTNEASNAPSKEPSGEPTGVPSDSPSTSPSNAPSTERSGVPSPNPSDRPTVVASDAPSDAPVTPAPITDAPVTAAPVTDAPVMETAAPSHLPSDTPSLSLAPSASPSKPASPYCNALEKDTCTLCEPFRSPDYCDPSESFPALVASRTNKFRNQAQSVSDDGYWFHYLEDKIAGYLLTVEQNLLAPTIYCCVTKVEELAACLKDNQFMSDDGSLKIAADAGSGIVIKATTFHSNQGVFILTNNTSLDPGQVLDLHSNNAMTFNDIEAGLNSMQASKIIVEEFIGEDLPTEYKLHVVNGKVQAIDVIQDRGGDCGCYAVVDMDFTRLDYHGCFEPGGTDYKDPTNPECTSIDFDSGALKAGPVKKDMYLCETVAMPNQCVVDDMIKIAETLGNRIGVAMRVDVFVVGDNIYVQEYSPNPMNGLRHCAAKVDESGCVDSCFLGREWKASGSNLYGGNATAAPTKLDGFLAMTNEAQCALIENAVVDNKFKSSCVVGTD